MPTGVTSSIAFRNAAHEGGRIAFLDAGPDPATIELYDGTRPANGAAVTTQVLLATLHLDKPCATVAAGVMTLLSADAPLVMATGTPTWARVKNGAAAHAFDCDASVVGGGGQVTVPAVPIYAGGRTNLASGTLTQA